MHGNNNLPLMEYKRVSRIPKVKKYPKYSMIVEKGTIKGGM
jgi:hypothetical protein